MNKRFSTLLAAALVAGSVSASAAGDLGNMVTGVKTGDLVTLNADGKLVSLNEDGKLDYTTLTSLIGSDANTAFSGMWQITVIPSKETSGTPTYSFVNKLTGLPFAVELKTNNKGVSTDAALFDEEGETVWAYNSTLGLYHVTKDSTFYFGTGYKLSSVKGGLEEALAKGSAAAITPAKVAALQSLTLTPKIFNQITTTGKLLFNNKKDVLGSSVENYLKTKTWKAASAINGQGDNATNFLLATTDSTKSKNPYVLVVDTNYFDIADQFHHIIIDTLGAKPAHEGDARVLTAYANTLYREVKKDGKVEKVIGLRPIETASFRGTYFLAEDSVVLYANYEPAAADVAEFAGNPGKDGTDAYYTYNNTKYTTLADMQAAIVAAIESAKYTTIADQTAAVKDWSEEQDNTVGSYTVTYTAGKEAVEQKDAEYSFQGTKVDDFATLKTQAKAAWPLKGVQKTEFEALVDAWVEGDADAVAYTIDLGQLALTDAQKEQVTAANITGAYAPAVVAEEAVPAKYTYSETDYATLAAAQDAVIAAFTKAETDAAKTATDAVNAWNEGAEVDMAYENVEGYPASYTAAVAGEGAIPANPAYRGISFEAVSAEGVFGHIALTPLDKNKIVITPSFDAEIESEEAATAANFILPLIQPEYTLDMEDGRITVADDVYTIQREDGKYLAAPIYTNGNNYEWVTLDEDFQNADHMPAYQWVVLKDRRSSDKSPITIANREYETLAISAQLYLTEDKDTIADAKWLGNEGALKFKSVSAAAKADSLLGYKNLDGDSLQVLRYTFNHFSPYDATQFIGVSSKDSVMVVKDSKTSFSIGEGYKMVNETFGYDVTDDVVARIPGLKQLYRTAYYMTVQESNHINQGVSVNEDEKFVASKNVGSIYLYFKENNCDETGEYYALVNPITSQRAGVAENTKNATLKYSNYDDVNVSVFAIDVNDAPLYRTLYKADGSVAGIDTIKIFSVNNSNEFLGVEANPAYVVKGIDFLGMENAKAGVGYGLIADSVRVNRGYGYIKPQYLLSIDRQVVVGKDAVPCPDHGFDPNCPHWIPGTASFVRANFLVNTVDSVDAGNKDYTWSKNNRYIRPAFIDAIHMGDSLYILKDQFAGIANEKIDTAAIIKANNDKDTKGQYIIGLDSDAHKKCTFSFRLADPAAYADDVEKDAFLIESMPYNTGDDIAPYDAYWVRLQNNVIVIANETFTGSWDDAMLFDLASLSEGDNLATDNEAITISDVKVIATEGGVQIIGAQGKKVIVSNILGQVVANTVLTSDNATIAAPAGVVVVAIEGEDAVKAIVK